jgi:hypothetical protein
MRTLEDLPIVKALPPLGRDVAGAPVPVDVPLADIGGGIAILGERIGQAVAVGLQVDVVDEHAVRERVLARQQARSIRRANRAAGDSVGEIHALPRQAIQVGRTHDRVAGIAGRLCTPLVAKDKNHVGLFDAHCASLSFWDIRHGDYTTAVADRHEVDRMSGRFECRLLTGGVERVYTAKPSEDWGC